jgi:hypothetical protein
MMSRQYVYNGRVKKQDNKDQDQDQENKIYYKILDPDWTCLGYQYQLGGTYSIPEKDLILCKRGFHCCEHPLDCLEFYSASASNHYVEVKMLGKIVTSKPDDDKPKYATNILKIEREIPYEEWLELCTVMVSSSSGPYYEENDWLKGKLSEKRVFYSNGNKKSVVTFLKDDAFPYSRYTAPLKWISYFPNGMENHVRIRSELCSPHNDLIMRYENGKIKLTEIWVRKEGNIQCIRTTCDEQGDKEVVEEFPLFWELSKEVEVGRGNDIIA